MPIKYSFSGLRAINCSCGFILTYSRFKIQNSRFKIQNSRFKIQDSKFAGRTYTEEVRRTTESHREIQWDAKFIVKISVNLCGSLWTSV
jgi:hypothetical protein